MSKEGKLKEELERKYMELQILQSQYSVVKDTLDALVATLNEIRLVKDELGIISQLSKEENILVPLGSRLLIPAKITEPSKMIFNLGAGVYAVLKPEDVKAKLDDYEKRIGEDIGNLRKNMSELIRRITILQDNIRKIQEKLAQKSK